MHNGVDLSCFTGPQAQSSSQNVRTAERTAARAALPALEVPADAPLVVCVGRLCPQKGQRTLLSAWPQIAGRCPGAWLVLVGDGPDRRRTDRSGTAAGAVRGSAATR